MAGPVLAAGVAGAASLAGGLLSNRGNKKEASKNRKFQERMRNTQWQSTIADMTAAGVNPALAYSQGSNASPSGSTAQVKDAVSPAISSAMQMKRMEADLKLIEAQTFKAIGEGESAAASGKLDMFRQGWMTTALGEGGKMPYMTMMENELGMSGARLGKVREETRKDKLSGDILEPMAEIARELGVSLPILMMMMKGLPGLGAVGGRAMSARAAAKAAKRGTSTSSQWVNGVKRTIRRQR